MKNLINQRKCLRPALQGKWRESARKRSKVCCTPRRTWPSGRYRRDRWSEPRKRRSARRKRIATVFSSGSSNSPNILKINIEINQLPSKSHASVFICRCCPTFVHIFLMNTHKNWLWLLLLSWRELHRWVLRKRQTHQKLQQRTGFRVSWLRSARISGRDTIKCYLYIKQFRNHQQIF